MRYEEERVKIIEVCRHMQALDFFLGTWGNVSLRMGDHILLTPSRVDYQAMLPQDIVIIDMEGNKVEGERNPTSEKEVHRQIMLVRDDVKAIVHAHTKNAMTLSATHIREVPCMVEEMSQLMGGAIPLSSEYVPAEQHFELGKAAAAAVGDKNGVILKNHGPVSCGRELDEAVLSAKVIEKSCEIYLAVAGRLNIHEIPEQYVKTERHRFLYTYGKEKT